MLSYRPIPGGSVGQAVRILDSALARPHTDDDPVERVEVLIYRAELAMVLHDPQTAAEMLARAQSVTLKDDESERQHPRSTTPSNSQQHCGDSAGPAPRAAVPPSETLLNHHEPATRARTATEQGRQATGLIRA